jgi:hypothetical protein
MTKQTKGQRRIGDRTNQPQRVIRDPLLKVYVAEKTAASGIIAAHRYRLSNPKGSQCTNFRHPFFRTLLKVDGAAGRQNVIKFAVVGSSQHRR